MIGSDCRSDLVSGDRIESVQRWRSKEEFEDGERVAAAATYCLAIETVWPEIEDGSKKDRSDRLCR